MWGLYIKMKRILIADDEEDVRDYLKNIISEIPNIELTFVDSGETLLERIKETDYDFVLTDNEMRVRGIRGVDAITEMRKLGKIYPIYLMSGSAKEEEAKAAGANGFIAKPIWPSTIREILGQYLK